MVETIALSIRQPWAWAIMHGGKDIENRSATSVRKGSMKPRRIAVNAAKGMTRDEYEYAHEFMATIGVKCPQPDALIRGAIIGEVTVLEIVKQHPSEWFFGPRGLVLTDVVPIDPIPCGGSLGYFTWTPGGDLVEPLRWMRRWVRDWGGGQG